jgi:hypothetical protein
VANLMGQMGRARYGRKEEQSLKRIWVYILSILVVFNISDYIYTAYTYIYIFLPKIMGIQLNTLVPKWARPCLHITVAFAKVGQTTQ